MSKDKSQYDNIMPFFGLDNDHRIRLYLDALKSVFDKNEELVLTKEMEQLKNKHFNVPNTDRNDDDIHSEWENFKADMLNSSRSQNTSEMLNIVKSNAGITQNGKFKDFIQRIIKAHSNIFNFTNDNITDKSFTWQDAVRVELDYDKIGNIFRNINMGIANTGIKHFTFKFNKYILYLLLEQNAEIKNNDFDTFWSDDVQEKDTYFRLASNRELLYTTDSNGNKIDVSPGSNAYHQLSNDNCIGTKVKENNGLTCNNYISKCIKGNASDIQACKEFMQNSRFWEIVPKEVNEMLPIIAQDTLNSFGFRIITKNNLKIYESYGSWSQGLSNKNLTQEEINNIRTNTKLTQYLTMLVNKINSNPAILNEEYNALYKFDPQDHINTFSSWKFFTRGMRPRVIFKNTPNHEMNIIREIGSLNNSLLTFRSSVNNRIAYIPGSGLVVKGLPYSLSSPYVFSTQIGGAAIQMVPSIGDEENIKLHYPRIKGLLNASENMLHAKGKKLDLFTKNKIEEYLESYRKSEEKLYKAIKYADRYIDLINIYKEYDSENVLSMDHLKSFVEAREKYFDKTIGKQNDLLSAIERIVINVNEALDKNIN